MQFVDGGQQALTSLARFSQRADGLVVNLILRQ